ncbi:AAA family ATPase [Haloarcula rubripromontorii]|uniref:DNA 3'-5' helicase n=1 Tax=Haloarcula rubripromontorii TaxID=1705562 RepID=A0A847U399_9EURY|nr:AAA family ATPase [Haloarcula rubripromontorii]
MPWTNTQQWLTEEESTLLSRVPLLRRFVSVPDQTAHEHLRQDIADALSTWAENSETEVADCRQLYQTTLKEPWLRSDKKAATDRAIPTLDDITPIEQQIDALNQQLESAVETGTAAYDIEHTPPTSQQLWCAYLTKSELEQFNDLKRQLTALQAAVKIRDDVETIRRRHRNLCRPSTSLRKYDEYLPSDEQQQLIRKLESLVSRVTDARNQLETPPQAVRDRLDELESQLRADREFVEQYNEGGENIEGFVAHEIERSRHLFEEYDDENHSLNTKQAQAVVRNNRANQVVAGPGTGKTVTLTARIAYLIHELGVDPEEIIALTLTNSATEEMEQRLEEWFDINSVECSTFHSFGLNIAMDYLDRPRDLIVGDDILNFIKDTVPERRRTDPEFREFYAEFLRRLNTDLLQQSEFDTREEFFEARREKRYTTLKGEEVESHAEKKIADWLFEHGVEYRHEDLATWAETAADKGSYNPDFYLPDHDLYIEHWGLDENADVAPWFSWTSEEYIEKLLWAREQFETAEKFGLINTYEFQHENGRLEQVLAHRLELNGVSLTPKSTTQLIEDTYQYNDVEGQIYSKFKDFVQKARQFNLSRDEIRRHLTEDDPRQYYFGQCGIKLYEDFAEYIDANRLMIFSDMISTAIDAVADPGTAYADQYEHVLVDEFQDVSGMNVELLSRFTDGADNPRLFCVGDDWQSIYSFQGSEVKYFVEFGDHFAPHTRTMLTKNYRSPSQVVRTGEALIEHNDKQISKQQRVESGTEADPQLHILPDGSRYEYKESVGEFAAERTQRYLEDESAVPEDIMILCHLDRGAPYLDAVKTKLEQRRIPYDGKDDQYRTNSGPWSAVGYDDDCVSVFSIHQSKGREAEHVIILHATDDDDGIPLADRDNLLAPVEPVDTNSEAEARRLFYVAITRAEQTLDICTQRGNQSKFVNEIEAHLTDIHQLNALDSADDTVTVEGVVTTINDDSHESKQQEGTFTDETGACQFIIWDGTDVTMLEQQMRYQLRGVRVDEFQGRVQLHLTEATEILSLGKADSEPESTDTIVEAEVQSLFDDLPDNIQQKGYAWDGSEELYVTVWSGNDSPELSEGTTYQFINPRLDEWKGTTDLIVHSDTRIEPAE